MLLMMLKKGNHAVRNDYKIQTLKFIKWHYYIVYLFHISQNAACLRSQILNKYVANIEYHKTMKGG